MHWRTPSWKNGLTVSLILSKCHFSSKTLYEDVLNSAASVGKIEQTLPMTLLNELVTIKFSVMFYLPCYATLIQHRSIENGISQLQT